MIRFNSLGQGYFVFDSPHDDCKMGSSKKLPVASHLSEGEYQLLMKVYAKHNLSMGLYKRALYTLSHIVKVERNLEDKCLNVYYDDGNWWHYSVDGSWY